MRSMWSTKVIVTVCTVLVGAGSASAYQIWNAATDFDLVNNPASLTPWSYGYQSVSGFDLYTVHSTDRGIDGWAVGDDQLPDVKKNTNDYAFIQNDNGEGGVIPAGALTAHPAINDDLPSTILWTAPFSGYFGWIAASQAVTTTRQEPTRTCP